MESNSPDLEEVTVPEQSANASNRNEAQKTPESQTPATVEIKRGALAKVMGFLNNLINRQSKQSAEIPTNVSDQVNQIRNRVLPSIEQARNTGHMVVDDNRAEEEAIKTLESLGEQLTAEEQQRKAVHLASAQANEAGQPLTEEMVATTLRDLKQQTAAVPPVTPISKPATVAESKAPAAGSDQDKAA